MDKKKRIVSSLLLLVLGSLAGCASYRAESLGDLSAQFIHQLNCDIYVGCKAFDKYDCKRFLDRDVISEGYQPVQLYIQNNSEKKYVFSVSKINISTAKPHEVAEKVHTSTVGRAVGYGAGALILWPLAIPAIVDGIGSANANKQLDYDYSTKAAQDQVIEPYQNVNSLLFIPIHSYKNTFQITLVDADSGKPRKIDVLVN